MPARRCHNFSASNSPLPRVAVVPDRGQGNRRVEHEGVGLQPVRQGGEIGQRLQGRAGLPVGLRRPVELAQRIGEAAAIARIRPVRFSSTRAAPWTVGGTRNSARAGRCPFPRRRCTRTTSYVLKFRRSAVRQVVSGRTRPSARPTRRPRGPISCPPFRRGRSLPANARRRAAAARRERALPGGRTAASDALQLLETSSLEIGLRTCESLAPGASS